MLSQAGACTEHHWQVFYDPQGTGSPSTRSGTKALPESSPRIAWGRNFSRRDMQNIQRDLFHVNGGGGRGGRFGRTDAGAGAGSSARRGRVILVGETRTIRVARTAGRNSNDERFAAARSRINAWNT